jgi:hypothetical protein
MFEVADSILDEVDFSFQFTEYFKPHYGRGVDKATNRNE